MEINKQTWHLKVCRRSSLAVIARDLGKEWGLRRGRQWWFSNKPPPSTPLLLLPEPPTLPPRHLCTSCCPSTVSHMLFPFHSTLATLSRRITTPYVVVQPPSTTPLSTEVVSYPPTEFANCPFSCKFDATRTLLVRKNFGFLGLISCLLANNTILAYDYGCVCKLYRCW